MNEFRVWLTNQVGAQAREDQFTGTDSYLLALAKYDEIEARPQVNEAGVIAGMTQGLPSGVRAGSGAGGRVTQTLPATDLDRRLARDMSEAQLQGYVTQMLTVLGYRWYHTHDSRRSQAGFPDICAVRKHRLLFIELKRELGRFRPGQQDWLNDLRAAESSVMGIRVPCCEVFCWRPSDWLGGEIERVLR